MFTNSSTTVPRLILFLIIVAFVVLGLKIKILEETIGNSIRNDGERLKILEDSVSTNRHFLDRIYCHLSDVLPSGGFCLSDKQIFTGHNDMWEGKLCKALEDLFGYSTVGDFGAGLGHYGRCFLRHDENFLVRGDQEQRDAMTRFYKQQLRSANLTTKPQVIKSWEGFDGAINVDKMTDGKIQMIDLAKPVDLGRHFDWVMTLEVGEHISSKNEDVFLDNVIKHACKGVVISWAIPGQTGHHHINNRPNNYIIEKVEKRGLKHDLEGQKRIRTSIDAFWFQNTLMVFRFPEEKC